MGVEEVGGGDGEFSFLIGDNGDNGFRGDRGDEGDKRMSDIAM